MDTVKKKKPKKKIITVKTSLKSIIRYEPLVEIIESASIETSKIINHSYQFLKLYFISLISKNKALPEIKKKLLRGIFKLFFSRTNQRKLDESEKEILSFYKKEYLPLISSEEKINSEKLSGILDYSAIAMETNIKNNIIAHYVDYVKRYINVIFEKKKFKEELDQLEMKKEDYTSQFSSFCKNLKNILSDVLFFDKNEIKSNLSPEEISSLREKVVPFQYLSGKAVDPEKNIIYFLKSKPLDFLPVSIKMKLNRICRRKKFLL